MKREVLIILQGRVNSNRLPGKVLMPIANIPLIVLCAKRLSNSGRKLIVATSKEKSDNKLCSLLKKNKIKFYRGSSNNVFSRFYEVSKKMNPKDIIIRATADNPIPDGKLVEILIAAFKKKSEEYIGIDLKLHNLPSGVSLEIFYVKKILELNEQKLKANELEHVTLKMYKNKKKNIFFKELKIFNCPKNKKISIDNLKDYRLVKELFKDIKNPINANWKQILKKL